MISNRGVGHEPSFLANGLVSKRRRCLSVGAGSGRCTLHPEAQKKGKRARRKGGRKLRGLRLTRVKRPPRETGEPRFPGENSSQRAIA